mmetsp:Transcript_12807/g.34466  ORF Transcript_12807/g.34466 Transcript_12807/m.34466 type:complete len:223 (+) Transcript_12807:163-831(+)
MCAGERRFLGAMFVAHDGGCALDAALRRERKGQRACASARRGDRAGAGHARGGNVKLFAAGEGFGKKPPRPSASSGKNPQDVAAAAGASGAAWSMEDVLKAMALKFLMLKNEHNVDEIRRVVADDVDMYGHKGASAACEALRKFFDEHADLVHTTRGADDFEVVAERVVQYGFEKSWSDPKTGERHVWNSFEKQKVERLYFAPSGQIKKVEVAARTDPPLSI